MRFDKGDPVKWTSQDKGLRKEISGTFIVRIPSQIDYRPFLPPETPISDIKTNTPRSDIERALVEVLQDDGKLFYYTPQFSLLRNINGTMDATNE